MGDINTSLRTVSINIRPIRRKPETTYSAAKIFSYFINYVKLTDVVGLTNEVS